MYNKLVFATNYIFNADLLVGCLLFLVIRNLGKLTNKHLYYFFLLFQNVCIIMFVNSEYQIRLT